MYLHLGNASIHTSTRQGGRAYQQDAADWQHDPSFIVAAVADGMGSGKGSGRIATTAVMLSLNILNAYGPEHPGAAIAATSDCVRDLIGDERGANDDTTMVLATVEKCGDVRVGWVGDSRAYVLTKSELLHRLTTDHNRAPYAPNVLTRALLGPDLDHRHNSHGADCQQHRLEFAEYSDSFDPALMVVLVTDGVCGVLTDYQISRILRSAPDAAHAARRLTAFALRAARAEGGNPDNATALVIDLQPNAEV